jgi:hypothetical protein
VFVVTVLALVLSGIWYTNYVQRESERKWCGILGILTDGPAPTTERGRVTLQEMRKLRADFGC